MKSAKPMIWAGLLAAALMLAGCGDSETAAGGAAETAPQGATQTARAPQVQPGEVWYTTAQVREGRGIYNNNCASCHGAMGQGARNWRERGPDGNFPAPPLNGSGHTWHHPMPALEQIIREGGPANMPAWGQRFSDTEIRSVLAYVQSLWPQQVYNAWAQRMQRNG